MERSHQLSDEHVQEKLGLTAKEFHQFREDELTITPDLINKLVEITGVSEQFWKNRLDQKTKALGVIMKTFKTVTMQKVTTLVFDGCGIEASADSDYEFQEFISISNPCGYGSIHGDGKQIDIDLCQQFFADMCGDMLRVTESS